MRPSFQALNDQAVRATEKFLRHRSILALENMVELALTNLPINTVVDVLKSNLEKLSEYTEVTPDYTYHDPYLHNRQLEGLRRFLSENELTKFQMPVVTEILHPDSGPAEYSQVAFELRHHAGNLKAAGWQPMKPKGDMVNRPEHYIRFPLEPTQYAMEYSLDWCRGNALKYVCRFPFKNGAEDLDKAARYMEMFVKFLDGDPEWSK